MGGKLPDACYPHARCQNFFSREVVFVVASDDMDHSAIRGGWAQPWDTTSRQLKPL